MHLIEQYFGGLTAVQKERFAALDELYRSWNEKINLISRRDIDNLYEHHVLHSLSIAKVIDFKDGTSFIDVGTGGGLPGIPLAILLDKCNFTLVDSVGKKVKVAADIAQQLGLTNVATRYSRMEDVSEKADFIVSRGVMPLQNLAGVSRKNINKKSANALPNGLICLKGGELDEEVRPFKKIASVFEISNFFREEFFSTKKIIYIPLT